MTERLLGKRVLLVERDGFLAGYVASGLARAGAEVLGPVACAADAQRAAESADAAIVALEMNELRDRLPLPVVWMSGRAIEMTDADAAGAPCFYRPFGAFQLVEAVEQAVGRSD